MHLNRTETHPCCWIRGIDVIRACLAAARREQLLRAPVQKRVWWWTQLRAVRTVRALFF